MKPPALPHSSAASAYNCPVFHWMSSAIISVSLMGTLDLWDSINEVGTHVNHGA